MTVTSTVAKIAVNGTGADTNIPVGYKFLGPDDLVVIQKVVSTGVETTMIRGTHYTVSGGGGGTGTVTVIDGATNFVLGTMTWTIRRSTPKTQETDYVENDDFPAETHEAALDKATFIDQEFGVDLDRSIKVPISDPAGLTTELPDSVSRASKLVGFDSAGNVIATSTGLVATATVSSYGQTLIDAATADAARDVLGIETDVEASLPGSANNGDLYISTDTGRAFVWQGAAWVSIIQGSEMVNKNHLINGSFSVNTKSFDITTRGYASVVDTDEIFDGWRFYEDSASVGVVDQLRSMDGDDLPSGFVAGTTLNQATVDVKWGIGAMVDTERTSLFRDSGFASLRFRIKRTSGTTLAMMRAAVIEWTGTRDSMTLDPISAWGAQGVNPTLAANFAYANTPSTHHVIDATWQTFTLNNIAISGSANNLLVLIWADVGSVGSTSTDTIGISGVELLATGTFRNPESRSVQDDRMQCARHYFPVGGVNNRLIETVYEDAAQQYRFTVRSPVEMYDGITAAQRPTHNLITGDWLVNNASNISVIFITPYRGALQFAVVLTAPGYGEIASEPIINLSRLQVDAWV